MSETIVGGKVGVLGGGAFGWGLADAAARAGREVLLWSRRPQREATAAITVTQDLAALAAAELIFVAVPSPYVAEVAGALGEHLDGQHFLVHVSRGVVGEQLATLTTVLRRQTPCRRIGALGGPLVAAALSAGAPGGAVIGTRFPEVRAAVRAAIGGPSLRIYSTDDVLGVELGATLAGLLSLALGFGMGMGMGAATLAVMATRGLGEATRIGVSLGARAETFQGLAGIGDLLAAFADDGRPEVAVGKALAGGASRAAVSELTGAYVEGVTVARWIAGYIERTGISAPLLRMIAGALEGQIRGDEVVERLMAREVGDE
jgi:glycerol-3-phosphate dehydrogenase (NAD(P)+)